MNAATARAGEPSADDPRNQVLDMLEAMLDAAIHFAKAQDCEAQLRARIKRMLPDLAPAGDLFAKPIGRIEIPDLASRAVAAEHILSDLFLTMVQSAPSRLTQRRLTSAEHKAHEALAEFAGVLLDLRKQERKA